MQNISHDNIGQLVFSSRFLFRGAMERKDYKSLTLFSTLSNIGGFYTVINGASVLLLSMFLSEKFLNSEAINIMKLSDQEQESKDKMKVEETKKKLETRFSFASIYGLFDATTYLHEKTSATDEKIKELDQKYRAELD